MQERNEGREERRMQEGGTSLEEYFTEEDLEKERFKAFRAEILPGIGGGKRDMTKEEIKQMLRDAEDMDEQIRSKEREIEAMKELAQSIHSPQLGRIPASKGCATSYVDEAVSEYVDAERKLEQEKQALIRKKQMIYHIIEAIPNLKYRRVLRYRYLEGCCWKVVADKVGCGVDNVFYLHRKAIESIVTKT